MENIIAILKEANTKLNTADHLAYVTYPVVKESKLLLTTVENLYTALILAMEALLQYDRYYKRISYVPHEFQSKYEIFKKISMKYNLDRMAIASMLDIRSLLELHKKSPMVFTREQKLVIASQGFNIIKTLNIDMVKRYIEQAKPLISKINKVIQPNANDRRLA
ncbi:hypothetical protein HYX18_03855 [Candidatus Woesearchaeota archaeon]|nr:hypothetical protein [Candidatus Woesearchaeota archaeon]